jgi:hypothetical protein
VYDSPSRGGSKPRTTAAAHGNKGAREQAMMFHRDTTEYFLWVYFEPSGRDAPRVWSLRDDFNEHAAEIIGEHYADTVIWWEVIQHTDRTVMVASGDTEPKPDMPTDHFTARIF